MGIDRLKRPKLVPNLFLLLQGLRTVQMIYIVHRLYSASSQLFIAPPFLVEIAE